MDAEELKRGEFVFSPGYEWLSEKRSGWQFGEAGILTALIDRVGNRGYVAECGCGSPTETTDNGIIGYHEPCGLTTELLAKSGRTVVLIDKNPSFPDEWKERLGNRENIVTKGATIGVSNGDRLHEILNGHLGECEGLVLDVDGNDAWLWASTRLQPKVVMIEHHDLCDGNRGQGANLPPFQDMPKSENGFVVQATRDAVNDIAARKGYVCAAYNRINSLFVRHDVDTELRNSGGHLDRGESIRDIDIGATLARVAMPNVIKTITEWRNRLVPGGTLKVTVPDAEWCMQNLTSGQTPKLLMGDPPDAPHQSLYTRDSLFWLLASNGFANMAQLAAPEGWITMTGQRPTCETLAAVKMNAAMTVPRLGWNDTWGCIFDVLSKVGCRLVRSTGAYWDKSLETSTERAMDDGADWILFLDYDSIFSEAQLRQLMVLLRAYPEYDAMAPVQTKRGKQEVLAQGRMDYDTTIPSSPFPIKVKTAHFGMTLIRTTALAQMKRPWFEPDPKVHTTGKGWKDDVCREADIYFWHKFRDDGFILGLAPSIRIKHLELVATSLGLDNRVKFEYVADASGSNLVS